MRFLKLETYADLDSKPREVFATGWWAAARQLLHPQWCPPSFACVSTMLTIRALPSSSPLLGSKGQLPLFVIGGDLSCHSDRVAFWLPSALKPPALVPCGLRLTGELGSVQSGK